MAARDPGTEPTRHQRCEHGQECQLHEEIAVCPSRSFIEQHLLNKLVSGCVATTYRSAEFWNTTGSQSVHTYRAFESYSLGIYFSDSCIQEPMTWLIEAIPEAAPFGWPPE